MDQLQAWLDGQGNNAATALAALLGEAQYQILLVQIADERKIATITDLKKEVKRALKVANTDEINAAVVDAIGEK